MQRVLDEISQEDAKGVGIEVRQHRQVRERQRDAVLGGWQSDGRLASFTTVFSRTAARAYAQDALRRDGVRVARLIAEGAQALVCGGREMASGVAEALAEIVAPQALTLAMMKAEGRCVEDVY